MEGRRTPALFFHDLDREAQYLAHILHAYHGQLELTPEVDALLGAKPVVEKELWVKKLEEGFPGRSLAGEPSFADTPNRRSYLPEIIFKEDPALNHPICSLVSEW